MEEEREGGEAEMKEIGWGQRERRGTAAMGGRERRL